MDEFVNEIFLLTVKQIIIRRFEMSYCRLMQLRMTN